MKNTGVMCLVSIPADNEGGFRSIDMGNYFEHQGQRVLVTSRRLAEQYGHLVDVPVYYRHHPRPDTKGAAMRDVIDIVVDGYEEVADKILKLNTKEN